LPQNNKVVADLSQDKKNLLVQTAFIITKHFQ